LAADFERKDAHGGRLQIDDQLEPGRELQERQTVAPATGVQRRGPVGS
jgi:hypothetical protein